MMKVFLTKSWVVLLLIIVSATLICVSCMKDRFDPSRITTTEWDPEFALPLVNARLGPYDILAKTDTNDLIVIDPATGLMALVYEGELFSFNASEIVDLPGQSLSKELNLDAGEITTFTTSGSITKQFDTTYAYTPNAGVQIESIDLKSGNISINLESNFQHDGTLVINIPSLTLNGTPFSKSIPIAYSGSTVIISQTYDLAGYTLDMSTGPANYNEIPIEYVLTLDFSGQPVSTSDYLRIDQSFNDFSFLRIFGDFGQQTVSVDEDSINIRIFNSTIDGYFQLMDPKIKIKATNSFGFPLSLDFTELKTVTYTQSPPVTSPIRYEGNPNPSFLINAPGISQVGDSVITNITIDNTNSDNITDLVNPTPKYLYHAIQATSNPGTAPYNNFITDQSRFRVDTEVELPLDGYAYGWTLQDTLEFEFTEEDNPNEVQSILLRVITENSFPINARMQLYFTDNNYNILDSLMPGYENIIRSGDINSDGKVIKSTKTITDIIYEQARVPALVAARHVIIKAEAESYGAAATNSDNPVVKIYDTYEIKVRMGLKLHAKVMIN